MRTDPIVDAIHRIRRAHAKRFNYDLDAIFADIRKRQEKRKNLVDMSCNGHVVSRVTENPATYLTKLNK
jgi:hypothetical protein